MDHVITLQPPQFRISSEERSRFHLGSLILKLIPHSYICTVYIYTYNTQCISIPEGEHKDSEQKMNADPFQLLRFTASPRMFLCLTTTLSRLQGFPLKRERFSLERSQNAQ